MSHQIKPYRKTETFCGKKVSKKIEATSIHYGADCKACREGYEHYCVRKLKAA